MRCLSPIPAARTPHEVRLHPPSGFGEPLQIPCGGCLHCRLNDRLGWALRGRLEALDFEDNTFTTLTLNDEHLTHSVEVRHLQLFYKRLRKELGGYVNAKGIQKGGLHDKHGNPRKLRHLSCGEYGEENGRPHYHAILYGVRPEDDADLIDWCWGQGKTHNVRAENGAIHYVVGYQFKKMNEPEHAFHYGEWERLERETGEVTFGRTKNYWQNPPFRIMSKNPGIGGNARKYRESWRTHATMDGRTLRVPRFLHKAWFDGATDLEKEDREWEIHKRQLQKQQQKQKEEPHAQETDTHARYLKTMEAIEAEIKTKTIIAEAKIKRDRANRR